MSNDKYEYRLINPNACPNLEYLEKILNDLGSEGFRFISTLAYSVTTPPSTLMLFSKPRYMKMTYKAEENTGRFNQRGGSY
jgi:hypothetical protein